MQQSDKRKLDNIFRRLASVPSIRKKLKSRTVGIFLLSDKEMKRLKKAFLPRKKGPANVLAFPEPAHWPRPETKMKPLGEIYLNRKFAVSDAATARLLLHGLLHLLGYEHKKKSDRIKMEKVERELGSKFLK